jgi:hypothetical protein
MAYRLHLPKRTTTDRQVSTVRALCYARPKHINRLNLMHPHRLRPRPMHQLIGLTKSILIIQSARSFLVLSLEYCTFNVPLYISRFNLRWTKSANLFYSYTEITPADFSCKQKSANFLKLYRELPSLPNLSTEPLLFPIDTAVVFNK